MKQRQCRDSRCAVWRQYRRPEATDGVLKVPLKGSGYLSRLVCTRCSLTDSHPVRHYPTWCILLASHSRNFWGMSVASPGTRNVAVTLFMGNWTCYSDGELYNGTAMATQTPGACASLSFTFTRTRAVPCGTVAIFGWPLGAPTNGDTDAMGRHPIVSSLHTYPSLVYIDG